MIESALYLLGYYWPYMLGALLIGIGSGWWSGATPRRRS
jgi:hypothetical protein